MLKLTAGSSILPTTAHDSLAKSAFFAVSLGAESSRRG